MITQTRWLLRESGSTPHRRIDFFRLRFLNLQIVRIDARLVRVTCDPFSRNTVHTLDIGPWRGYLETCGAGLPDPTLMISGRVIPHHELFDLDSLGATI